MCIPPCVCQGTSVKLYSLYPSWLYLGTIDIFPTVRRSQVTPPANLSYFPLLGWLKWALTQAILCSVSHCSEVYQFLHKWHTWTSWTYSLSDIVLNIVRIPHYKPPKIILSKKWVPSVWLFLCSFIHHSFVHLVIQHILTEHLKPGRHYARLWGNHPIRHSNFPQGPNKISTEGIVFNCFLVLLNPHWSTKNHSDSLKNYPEVGA